MALSGLAMENERLITTFVTGNLLGWTDLGCISTTYAAYVLLWNHLGCMCILTKRRDNDGMGWNGMESLGLGQSWDG